MRTITRALALAVVVVVFAVPFTPAPSWVAGHLAVSPRLEPADAIVVLGGGVQSNRELSEQSMRRTIMGIRLFRRGLAPVLVFSGGTAGQTAAEADVMAALARELGIPAQRILVETVSFNTRSEAVEVARLIGPEGKRQILLVTDPFHMGRAQAVFERAGFVVRPAPSDPWVDGHRRPEGNLWLMRQVGEELLARTYYVARGWL